MSLSAYTFQFYSYNMPSYRPGAIIHNDSMDVDDIDLSHPPPKPPRMAALQNQLANNNCNGKIISSNNNIGGISNINSQPAICYTPTSATQPTTAPLNYFRDVNETPKSIYSSGLGGATTSTAPVTGEMQLHTRRSVPQKQRWSHELRAKALEMSKHSSGSSGDNCSSASEDSEPEEEHTKPQTMVGHKSWSCQIKEKALEMSKRNSIRFEQEANEGEEEVVPNPADGQATEITSNNLSNATFAANNTSIMSGNANSTFGSSMGNISLNSSNNTCNTYNSNDNLSQGTLRSVKERISYFNTLTTAGNNTFINLLKNSKTQVRATLNNTTSSTQSLNTNFAAPAKPKRWSTHINLHLEQPTPVPEAFGGKSSKWQANGSSLSLAGVSSASSSNTGSASFSFSSIQRKNSLRRKPSIEKSRRPIQRQNSTAGSNGGTKPQMHAVMEDLSLVMPVKLRVAEYERRIMMES
ncbi:bottleneck [Musca autumnalis]|uniref:bottleneck n=1 Tax=Musca autumnalis TaxID=221902 RepID=UPI003CE9C966